MFLVSGYLFFPVLFLLLLMSHVSLSYCRQTYENSKWWWKFCLFIEWKYAINCLTLCYKQNKPCRRVLIICAWHMRNSIIFTLYSKFLLATSDFSGSYNGEFCKSISHTPLMSSSHACPGIFLLSAPEPFLMLLSLLFPQKKMQSRCAWGVNTPSQPGECDPEINSLAFLHWEDSFKKNSTCTRKELNPIAYSNDLENVPLTWVFLLSPLLLPAPSPLFPGFNSQRIYLHQALDLGSTFRETNPRQ